MSRLKLRAVAAERGQRDERMGRWLLDCPVCRAGASDAEGLYRPLKVPDAGTAACDRGCPEALILAGLGVLETFPLLTGDEMLRLPAVPWLIDGLIPPGLGVIFGASGTWKTFLALSLAGSVAAGTPWLGRPSRRGTVVYVVAEGRSGIGQRYAAWLAGNGLESAPGLRFLPEAVNLRDPAAEDRLRRTLALLPEPPHLFVDTLARSMPGADENSAREMGEVLDAVDRLRGERNATVVHHTGKDGDDERGSSALRAAADWAVKLTRDGRSAVLSCRKLKDAEEWAPIRLAFEPCGASGFLAKVLDPGSHELTSTPEDSSEVVRAVLAAVASGPLSKNAIAKAVDARKATVIEVVDLLTDKGFLVKRDGRWGLPGPAGEVVPRVVPAVAAGRAPEVVPVVVPEVVPALVPTGRNHRKERPEGEAEGRSSPRGAPPVGRALGTAPTPEPPEPTLLEQCGGVEDAVLARLVVAFDAHEVDAAELEATA